MKQFMNTEFNADDKTIPVIGITGGVGSGKSEVMRILEEDFHAAVILADEVGHDLMAPGQASYRQILAHFGEGIIDPSSKEKEISRPALSALVFSDEKKLAELNRITHTAIREEILRRIHLYRERREHPFIALEAALLIEGGYEDVVDQLWYIYVTEENRILRLMENRGYSEEKSRSIIRRQLSEEEFRNHCSVIIDNNGSLEETRESVRKAVDTLGNGLK